MRCKPRGYKNITENFRGVGGSSLTPFLFSVGGRQSKRAISYRPPLGTFRSPLITEGVIMEYKIEENGLETDERLVAGAIRDSVKRALRGDKANDIFLTGIGLEKFLKFLSFDENLAEIIKIRYLKLKGSL